MTTKAEKLVIYQKYLVLCAFSLLIVFLLAYGYFLNRAVMNVVKRTQLSKQIVDLNSHVGQLENQSFTLKSGITLDLATSLGFLPVNNPIYISRTPSSKGLSLNQPSRY